MKKHETNGRASFPKPGTKAFNQRMEALVVNATLDRAALLAAVGIDGDNRDLNKEAGYPDIISKDQYRTMYDREGLAARVVNVFPDESWALNPQIQENKRGDDTEFEEAWKALEVERHLIHYLHRIDRVSGIGHYGLLLLGINDGRSLDRPVAGMPTFSEDLDPTKAEKVPLRKLAYMRTFDESLVTINKWETNKTSPRHGQPTQYDVSVVDARNVTTTGEGLALEKIKVHWHRVLHVADNRESGEVFGAPRMRATYNRLHDMRKIMGGSAEMFWKGGFPGYSFEMPPELAMLGGTIDETSVKAQIKEYYDGTERYLTLKGLTAKSLAPQVASPKEHVHGQVMAISIALGIPMRVFIGSEEAKLSSTQDAITWNKRLQRRQDKYISPFLVRPFVQRLIMLGILPNPSSLLITWPDLNTSTNQEQAEVAEKLTKAMAMYAESGLTDIMTPVDFFVHIVGIAMDQAQMLWDNAQKESIRLEARIESEDLGREQAKEQVKKNQVLTKPKAATQLEKGR